MDRAADFSDLTPDELEQLLGTADRRIARLRWVQVQAIRSAARRQVPLRDGCRTTAEWIRGRVDTTPETARSLEAVAALDSSELDRALEDGDVGFDRVAEAARAGDIDLAAHLDLAAMRRRSARRHRVTREQEIHDFGSRSLTYQRNLFGTVGRLWAEGPALETDLMLSAIDQAADLLPTPPTPEARSTRRFDALNSICRGDAERGAPSNVATVIVDAREAANTDGEAGAWVTSGARIGPNTLERILCDSVIEVTGIAETGMPLAHGTARSKIPPRTRRWVLARDGGSCTADGCISTTRLQPHHIHQRSGHGTNDHDNLTTLCWYHHHVVVHGCGFTIDPRSAPHRRRFLAPRADGTAPGSDPPEHPATV